MVQAVHERLGRAHVGEVHEAVRLVPGLPGLPDLALLRLPDLGCKQGFARS